jgi:hypothetical protein
MPKPMYVWSGTQWVSVATEVESLAGFATQSYADNVPGTRLIVPTSVAVGSGSGSVNTNGTVTFSGASTVAINGVFSSAYDNYKIVLNTVGSSAANMWFRMRNSGTDETGNSYYSQLVAGNSTTISGSRSQATYGWAGQVNGTQYAGFEVAMYNPFNTRNTVWHSINTEISGGASAVRFYNFTGALATTTSYNSLLLYPDSVNITGTVSIYGLKN